MRSRSLARPAPSQRPTALRIDRFSLLTALSARAARHVSLARALHVSEMKKGAGLVVGASLYSLVSDWRDVLDKKNNKKML